MRLGIVLAWLAPALLVAPVRAQGFLEARYSVAGGASYRPLADDHWGGHVTAGFFPGQTVHWQVAIHATHVFRRASSAQPGLSSLGVEVLYSRAERRIGQGWRSSLALGLSAQHYRPATDSLYVTGWRAAPTAGLRLELWLSTRVATYAGLRVSHPFGGPHDLVSILEFGLAWRG